MKTITLTATQIEALNALLGWALDESHEADSMGNDGWLDEITGMAGIVPVLAELADSKVLA